MVTSTYRSLDRRQLLVGCAKLLSAFSFAACGRDDELRGPKLEFDPRALDGVDRLVISDADHAVEIRREGGELRARSLFCTHMGCVVEWKGVRNRYECPCHRAVFAPDGHPVLGPAKRPLLELAVVLRGDRGYVPMPRPGENP